LIFQVFPFFIFKFYFEVGLNFSRRACIEPDHCFGCPMICRRVGGTELSPEIQQPARRPVKRLWLGGFAELTKRYFMLLNPLLSAQLLFFPLAGFGRSVASGLPSARMKLFYIKGWLYLVVRS